MDEVGEEKDIFPFPPETELVSEAAADRFPVEREGDCMCFSIGDRMETLCSGDFSLEDMVNSCVKQKTSCNEKRTNDQQYRAV